MTERVAMLSKSRLTLERSAARIVFDVLRSLEPWAILMMVWQFGLHWAVLIVGGSYIVAGLIALGVVIGEAR